MSLKKTELTENNNSQLQNQLQDNVNNNFQYIYDNSEQIKLQNKKYKYNYSNNNISNTKEDISKAELKIGSTIFREGDKVMQNTNNYNIPYDIVDEYDKIYDRGFGVFNGDIGKIVEIDEEDKSMIVKYDDRVVYYLKEDIQDLSLAYAITVHKSQGSEYDVVIMPMSRAPCKLMTRKILYTAMTRAKKCIIFVGNENCFNEMINNQYENKRNSALCSKLYTYAL